MLLVELWGYEQILNWLIKAKQTHNEWGKIEFCEVGN